MIVANNANYTNITVKLRLAFDFDFKEQIAFTLHKTFLFIFVSQSRFQSKKLDFRAILLSIFNLN